MQREKRRRPGQLSCLWWHCNEGSANMFCHFMLMQYIFDYDLGEKQLDWCCCFFSLKPIFEKCTHAVKFLRSNINAVFVDRKQLARFIFFFLHFFHSRTNTWDASVGAWWKERSSSVLSIHYFRRMILTLSKKYPEFFSL